MEISSKHMWNVIAVFMIQLNVIILSSFLGLLALEGQLNSKKPKQCFGYKGLNHYYDEDTIKYAKLYINKK